MKKLLILIIVVAVIVLAWWMLSSDQATAPTTDGTNQATADTTSGEIAAELNGLTDADLDAEFKAIDADAAQL